MFSRQYPYAETGRVAAWPFALGGAIGGYVASVLVGGGPPVPINIVLWAIITRATAYIVFSSEGPRQRPDGMVQAAIADGIVAGVIACVSCAIIDVIVAAGAGTSGSHGVSAGTLAATVGLGALAGVVAGTALGYLVVPLAGEERLRARLPIARPVRSRNRRRKKR
jgi:hypothetical protein